MLVLAAALLAMGIAELALRLAAPQRTLSRIIEAKPARYRASDILPYELQPGSAGYFREVEFRVRESINSDGFRGAELIEGAEPRIVAIGDSFTFGHGDVDSGAWPARAQRKLAAATGNERLEVVNAGFAAGDYPDTYLTFLRHRAARLDPDWIVVGLFVGNDLDEDGLGERQWTEVDDEGLPLRIDRVDVKVVDGYRWPSRFGRYDVPVLRESHLAILVADALFVPSRPPESLYNPWIYRRQWAPRTERAHELVCRLVGASAREAARLDARFLVALFPAQIQVYPESFDLTDLDHDLDKPQRRLRACLGARGIDVVDLLPVFRRAAAGAALDDEVARHLDGPRTRAGNGTERLYFRFDSHWSPAGNELAAATMASALLERGVGRPR